MSHVLLVEDARDCQILVRETLVKIAKVTIVASLQEAKLALKREKFDLMILDLSLPDGDGMEFFSEFQSSASSQSGIELPVIFLTAKAEAAMQVTAFSLYIVKPLRPIEFRARVEAKLKRIASQRVTEAVLVRGELKIELGVQRASVSGTGGERRELELTGREFKLLYHLARHEGTVFTRDQLIAAVWGGSVHVLDRTVDTHIYTLRKKLGAHSHYIESEVGMGYRLNSKPAVPHSAPGSSQASGSRKKGNAAA
jgi:DNA-binding response OmpR family regulator